MNAQEWTAVTIGIALLFALALLDVVTRKDQGDA